MVRFGYDGQGFAGWARQPGRRTVEGELRAGLVRAGIVASLPEARLEVASRTDAGVSARANALAITSPLPGPALLRALNGVAPDVFAIAARTVPDGFRVRRAVCREYRYFLPGQRQRAATLDRGARLVGTSVDVRSFGRGTSSKDPVLRPILPIRASFTRGVVRIDVRAPSFVWGMVRKLVAALLEWEAGRLADSDLVSAATGDRPRALPMVPADGLVLWEVTYPLRWTVHAARLSRAQRRHLENARRSAAVRRPVLGAITSVVPDPGRSTLRTLQHNI